MGRDYVHACLRADGSFQNRLIRIKNRFLYKENAPVSRESAHQVLGSLKYEIPAKVREAHQIGMSWTKMQGCHTVFFLTAFAAQAHRRAADKFDGGRRTPDSPKARCSNADRHPSQDD